MDLVEHAVRLHHLRGDDRRGRMVDRCGLPARVVVIRRTPVGDLLLRLDQFAAVAAAGALAQRSDVAGPRLPSGVGGDGQGGGPVEREVQLGLDHRTADARVLEHAERPTPAQPQTDAVLALDEVLGDVVGQVQPALAVVRDRRAEHVVAHLLAVHVEFVITQGADVGRGRGRDLLQRDGLAQPGERPLVVLHPVRADPLAAPVGRRERSHGERRRLRSTARARRSGPTRGPSTSSATPSPAACRRRAPTATGSIRPCPSPRGSPGRRPARRASRPRAPGAPSAPGRGPRAESPRKSAAAPDRCPAGSPVPRSATVPARRAPLAKPTTGRPLPQSTPARQSFRASSRLLFVCPLIRDFPIRLRSGTFRAATVLPC